MPNGVDWTAVANIGWPIVVALPGGIAFIWQWIDRNRRIRERAPYLEIRAAYDQGHRTQDGWVPVSIFARNELAIPINVTALEAIRPRGLQLALPQRDHGPPALPDLERCGRGLIVDWRIRAGPPSHEWSGNVLLFVGSTARSISVTQVSIRARYIELDASRTKRTATAISERIELPLVTKSRT